MTSPALVALQAAINSNTLSVSQQAALSDALDLIIPTFPPPDEISNSIPQTEEVLARDWIAALYTIQAEGPGGGIPVVTAGTILANTTTALSAIPVASLPNAQPAIVESVGAEYSLQPIGDMTVDGITVLAALGDPLRVWERGDTIVAEQAVLQTFWFVDPVAGDDNSTGKTSGVPIKHVAEIMRRMGSWEPTIDGITIGIVLLNPNPVTDPYLFAPIFLNSGRLVLTCDFGTIATSFTGTLLAVTPKNRAANQPLQATFTTTTGALAPNMLLQNITRGSSKAFAVTDAAGTWTLSQPLASYDGTGLANSVAEVDTWANGDTIHGFVLPNANVGRIGGRAVDLSADLGQSHQVVLLTLNDPAGAGVQDPVFVESECAPLLYNCVVERAKTITPNATAAQAISLSTVHAGQVFASSNTFNGNLLRAGVFRASVASTGGIEFSGDCMTTTDVGSGLTVGNMLEADGLFLAAGSFLTLINGQGSLGGPVYGTGFTFSVAQGTMSYNAPASTALPGTGVTYSIAESANAYSNSTTAGVTTVHKVTGISAALLDAAAGAAGYGGLAYLPGIAALTAVGSAP